MVRKEIMEFKKNEIIYIDDGKMFDAGDTLGNNHDLEEIYDQEWEDLPEFISEEDCKIDYLNKNMFIDITKIKKLSFKDKRAQELQFGNADQIFNNSVNEALLFSEGIWDFLRFKYRSLHSCYPDIFRIENIKGKKMIQHMFEYLKVPNNSYIKTLGSNKGKSYLMSFTFVTKNEDIIIHYDGGDNLILFYNHAFEMQFDSDLYTILGLIKNYKEPTIAKNKIYIVYRNDNGFQKTGFDVKKLNININQNYNDDFKDISETIIKDLNNKKKTGLVILSGEPGTGKTTFIRFLTGKIKRDIIFISPDMVDQITDPSFIPFLIKNNDCILIIEDAEPALEKRHGGRSSAVSNVLNLTDGLLSDCLNISIVATFNTKEKNVDEALLRKGRLMMNYHFDRLNVDKSKKLLENNGINVEVSKPMTLAEIYYYEKDNNADAYKTRKVGF